MSALPTERYRVKGRVVVRQIGRDHLLVPVSGSIAHTNRIFPVNATALAIWQCLSSGGSLDEAARSLADRFEVAVATALEDARALLDQLLAEGLLEKVSA